MLCKNCGVEESVQYSKHSNGLFCSRKCARGFSTKEKRQEINEKVLKTFQRRRDAGIKLHGRFCTIKFRNCDICDKAFSYQRFRKTCSSECLNKLKVGLSPWHSNKLLENRNWHHAGPYISKFAGKVYLDSSWELVLAKDLDQNDIEWVRPNSMIWVDKTGKERRYHPDFYLPEYDIYLDPKNKYLVSVDKDKLNSVREIHKITLFVLDDVKKCNWRYVKELLNT